MDKNKIVKEYKKFGDINGFSMSQSSYGPMPLPSKKINKEEQWWKVGYEGEDLKDNRSYQLIMTIVFGTLLFLLFVIAFIVYIFSGK